MQARHVQENTIGEDTHTQLRHYRTHTVKIAYVAKTCFVTIRDSVAVCHVSHFSQASGSK
jgi:hypothetical protein